MKLNNLTGQTFGRLTVVRRGSNDKQGKAQWYCDCSCGTRDKLVRAAHLKAGQQSCGCHRRERMAAIGGASAARMTTHGQSRRTRTYTTWALMIARCYSEGATSYPYYGGRGIAVCDRWRHSFENFFADKGERPEGMTLDRIDPDGDYTPENTRWADRKTQARNKRSAA